ncbi:LPS export ABC transporter permease LptF [uncultured Pseudoteredinibacter sp.]|uniref:LPS export ABC transporter permease LptF n=1 Tax=uncultured Pseudoteredinibacter sp. TaxID=1641701 RepID=UPI0026288FB9|nr:LPS export ABC transporter permease LptF [uncultured Pseudoteredinibacter sp.]
MIIFRYLAREVMFTMLAVSSVLLLITMSGRFVKYLAQAAAGQLDADVLLSIMVFRLPGFLELVLPLGLFIGILLAYGRLYMESEMTVLSACGFSQARLTRFTLIPALVVAAFVALLSLAITPMGVDKAELILNEQKKRSEFDGLNPGRFMPLSRAGAVSYTESLSEDRKEMQQVFMAGQASSQGDVGVVKAKQGRQVDNQEYGQRYLVLNDGYRYEGKPGHQSYSVTKFAEQGQYLHVDDPGAVIPRKTDRKSTTELWQSEAISDNATLHWRFSLPVLVLIVSLLAVPLSKTNPRQGRYFKMIPAILLYIIYLVSLNAARGAAEDGKVSVWLGIWGIHGIFLAISILLMLWPDWIRKISYKPDAQEAPNAAA